MDFSEQLEQAVAQVIPVLNNATQNIGETTLIQNKNYQDTLMNELGKAIKRR